MSYVEPVISKEMIDEALCWVANIGLMRMSDKRAAMEQALKAALKVQYDQRTQEGEGKVDGSI